MAKGQWFEGCGTTLVIDCAGGTFALDWTELTVPALQGGDKIDTTSLANTRFTTGMPKTLIEVGDLTFTGELNATQYDAAIDAINTEGTATVTIGKTGDVYVFYGYLKEVTPGAITVGDKITMSGAFTVTNTVTTGNVPAETAPDITPYVAP